jgi:hypothetical protein
MKPKTKAFSESQFEDIINQKPSWLVRTGLSLFLIIVLSCLLALNFFKYKSSTEGTIYEEKGQVMLKIPIAKANIIIPGQTLYFQEADSVEITATVASKKGLSRSGEMLIEISNIKARNLPKFINVQVATVKVSYTVSFFYIIFERWKSNYRL